MIDINVTGIVNFIQNIAVVVLFLMFCHRLIPAFKEWKPPMRKSAFGLLFGTTGIVSMLLPLFSGEESIVSMKNILTALSAWLGGPIAAGVSVTLVTVARLAIGGAGAWPSIASGVTASLIGLVFYYFRRPTIFRSFRLARPTLIGLLVWAEGTAWCMLLPEHDRVFIIRNYTVVLAVLYPAAAILFHYCLNPEWVKSRETLADEATGLTPPDLFWHQMQQKMDARTPFYLTILNVDGLKTIVTLNSAKACNELLKEISDRLTGWLPDNAAACRMEANQFVVAVADPDPQSGALPLLPPGFWKQLQAALSEPYVIQHKRCHVAIEAGTTAYAGDGLSVDQLLPRAYAALQHARETGVNEAVLYNERLSERIRRLAQIEEHLKTAIEDDRLSIHYEPQFELSDGALRGIEAQLHWEHPEFGEVPAREFLPIAEKTKMIVRIGEWTLRQACGAYARIAAQGAPESLKLSVNVSGVQLEQSGFAALVVDVLREFGLSPDRLELELSEGSLLSSMENASKQMDELKAAGIRLALGKFGSSGSSIHFLRMFPFDTIKIDKSYIQDIGSAKEQDLTGSMIGFIKHLGYSVVAEGLETYEQLIYLKKRKCDYAQGHLFSKPLREDEIAALVHIG
ncbi:putative bifunctional diguanylate cyclase/phosphodiesterase [Cohnella suwonensis]|uniref:Bifunctional diguanylate cyclase/phosphodiesterase n=1 Tax=Cohnella suwonensis TaxID=696072 RepID=A0ABW0LNQ9_9BACL